MKSETRGLLKIILRLIKLVFLLVLLSALLLGIYIYLLFFTDVISFRGADFDKKIWLESEKANQGVDCIRGEMYTDLKNNYLKSDTSIHDVEELLGTGLDTGNEHQKCLDYNLGMCSRFRFDYDSLHICFDGNDKVDYVTHIQH